MGLRVATAELAFRTVPNLRQGVRQIRVRFQALELLWVMTDMGAKPTLGAR